MSSPKRRPGLLWMFFYGRPRRGFPWLLVGVLLAVLVLSLVFGVPGESGVARLIALVLGCVLLVGAVALAVVAVVVPRRRR